MISGSRGLPKQCVKSHFLPRGPAVENFRLGSRATESSRQRIRPCPLRTQSDRRPLKYDPSLRAMYKLMRCNKQRTSFDSRPSMRETQAIIDEQLRDVGWEADTGVLSISCAVKGRNFAIAEWPTASGPADRRGE